MCTKKKNEILVCSLLAMVLILSQARIVTAVDQSSSKNVLYPVFRNNRWGFINSEGGLIVTPSYEWVEDFSEGYAIVWARNKRGYIDHHGNFVIHFDDNETLSHSFSEGRAWFSNGKKFGCIDTRGDIIIPPRYDEVKDFCDGVAAVSLNIPKEDSAGHKQVWGYVGRTGQVVIPFQYSDAASFNNELARIILIDDFHFRYIDKTGKTILSLEKFYSDEEFVAFSGKFSEQQVQVSIDGMNPQHPYSFFVDRRGQILGGDYFEQVGNFSDGRAFVVRNTKVGFINGQGRIVIPLKFEEGSEFRSGMCRVREKAEWFYIDRDGEVALKSQDAMQPWNDAEDFHGELARVHIGGELTEETTHGPRRWKNGAWYYVDKNGKIIALCRYDQEGGNYFGNEISPEIRCFN